MNNSQQVSQQQQMATPISNLPLKTTPPDQSEIEDPLIQNVLKEFEDEILVSRQKTTNDHQPMSTDYQQNFQQPVHIPQQQPIYLPTHQVQYQQQYVAPKKKLIDIAKLKSAFIISVIVFILQNYNIVQMILSKLPETITKHTSGKEFMINFAMIFAIFYALMFFDLL